MILQSYGFIVKVPEGEERQNRHQITYPHFKITIVCVNSIEEACQTAQNLVGEGIQVLELCGGFGKQLCEKVIESIDGKIPVGYVKFSPFEQMKLEQFLSG